MLPKIIYLIDTKTDIVTAWQEAYWSSNGHAGQSQGCDLDDCHEDERLADSRHGIADIQGTGDDSVIDKVKKF